MTDEVRLVTLESENAELKRLLAEYVVFLKRLSNFDAEYEGFKEYRMCLVCKCLHPGKPKEQPWRYDHKNDCPLKAEIDRLSR
jgi:hypothetical protein